MYLDLIQFIKYALKLSIFYIVLLPKVFCFHEINGISMPKLRKNEVLFIKHLHRNQKKYSQYFSAIFIKSINRYLAHVKRVEIWSVFERTRTITYRYFEWHFWNWRDRRHIEVRIKKQTTFCFEEKFIYHFNLDKFRLMLLVYVA